MTVKPYYKDFLTWMVPFLLLAAAAVVWWLGLCFDVPEGSNLIPPAPKWVSRATIAIAIIGVAIMCWTAWACVNFGLVFWYKRKAGYGASHVTTTISLVKSDIVASLSWQKRRNEALAQAATLDSQTQKASSSQPRRRL